MFFRLCFSVSGLLALQIYACMMHFNIQSLVPSL